MGDRLEAPWPPELVAELNRRQASSHMAPYVCADGECGEWRASVYEGEYAVFLRTLVEASAEGWRCPKCGALQTWTEL